MARVLIAGFCVVPGPNRVGVQLRHVVRALSSDHTVDLLVLRAGEQPYVERQGNARILRVPIQDPDPRKQIDSFRRALGRQLDGAEYDVVVFRDGWSGIPVLEERARLKYVAVFDAARSPLSEPRLRGLELSSELIRDEEACLLDSDLTLAPHEPARRYMAARGRPDRVRLAPPGVDVDQFDHDRRVPGPPRILYIGELAPGRGLRILLRAMIDVVKRASETRLLLAGPIDVGFRVSIEKSLEELKLTANVDILGVIDHDRIPSLIATSSVCVAPSAVELSPKPTVLYPTKILEYMACRRAVVAPRRGSVTMLMKDGLHGLLFTPGDPVDLAAKLLQLLGDPELRDTLAAKGYELVRNAHTASGTRRAIRDAFRAIADSARWGERLARVVSRVPVPIGGLFATELQDHDLLETGAIDHETTQAIEELPDFDDDSSESTNVGADLTGDETRVDGGVGWIDRVRTQPHAPVDEWVVEETSLRVSPAPEWSASGDEDEDGTPVDIQAVAGLTPPLEMRFVAGEVDVPTPAPEPEPGPEDFEAASVMLGGRPDTSDETPTPTPLVKRSAETERPTDG